MAGEVKDFSGFETGANFNEPEAKDGDLSGASIVTTPAPPHSDETNVLKIVQGTSVRWRSFIDFTPSNDIIVGMITQFDRLPPISTTGGDVEFMSITDSGVTSNEITLMVRRVDATNHELVVFDAHSAEAATYANPYTEDTWHRTEVLFRQSDSSVLKVWIDGSEVISTTGKDFSDAGGDLRIAMRGQTPPEALVNPTTVYHNSYYVKTGGVNGTDDFIGDFEIRKYQIDKTGASPDVGDNLAVGAWTDTSDDTNSNEARYDAIGADSGYCIMNDSPGAGPNGTLSNNANILGAKWTWYFSKVKTGSSAAIRYGKRVGETNIVTTTNISISGSQKPWDIVQDAFKQANNRVPKYDEYFILGFKIGLAFDGTLLFLREAWSFLLLESPVPPIGVTTVHIKGGAIKGATIN